MMMEDLSPEEVAQIEHRRSLTTRVARLEGAVRVLQDLARRRVVWVPFCGWLRVTCHEPQHHEHHHHRF